jgi:hypothetical protein
VRRVGGGPVKELHRLIALVIEELYAERLAEQYEVLAYHFLRGEEWSKALDYLLRGAEKATKAFANREALSFYDQARVVATGAAAGPDHRQPDAALEDPPGRGAAWRCVQATRAGRAGLSGRPRGHRAGQGNVAQRRVARRSRKFFANPICVRPERVRLSDATHCPRTTVLQGAEICTRNP